jgi:hypothetical protein
MPIDSVQINEGTGKRYDTWKATKNSVDLQDQFVIPGEFPYPCYSVIASVNWTTTQRDLIQIMAGSTLPVLVRSISVLQLAAISAVATRELQLWRLTTAGTGGGAITPRPFSTAAAAAGATAMSKPTTPGTQGVQMGSRSSWFGTAAIPAPGAGMLWDFTRPGTQPLIIPAGTANGIALTNTVTDAGLTVTIEIVVCEVNFVPGA